MTNESEFQPRSTLSWGVPSHKWGVDIHPDMFSDTWFWADHFNAWMVTHMSHMRCSDMAKACSDSVAIPKFHTLGLSTPHGLKTQVCSNRDVRQPLNRDGTSWVVCPIHSPNEALTMFHRSVSGGYQSQKMGCFPLTHHLGGYFDHGKILKPHVEVGACKWLLGLCTSAAAITLR